MSVEFESPIDLNQLELQNVQLQQLGSDPLSPVEGQIWYRSDEHRAKIDDGAGAETVAWLSDIPEDLDLEHSTGLYTWSGVKFVKVDATHVGIGAMAGVIVDTAGSDTLVSYAGTASVLDAFVGSTTNTYYSVDSTGTLVQRGTAPTPAQHRSEIVLGFSVHNPVGTISAVTAIPDVAINAMSQTRDILNGAIGIVNRGVHPIPYSTALQIQVTGGTLSRLGIGYTTSITDPSRVTIAPTAPTTFQYRSKTGTATGNLTSIEVGYYDLAGARTAIGSTKFTSQRVYVSPTGAIRLQWGQYLYNSLALAIQALPNEAFTTYPAFENNLVLIGAITVRSTASNLSDTDQAVFTPASIFGEMASGGGGTATTSLQGAYNNSAEPEILTDTTRGALSIKRGTSADTDKVFEVINGAGATTASITGAGVITGSNLSGINSGDQTSVTGNAGTATKLATPRAINGVNFDGTAAITITAAPNAHTQAASTITDFSTATTAVVLSGFVTGANSTILNTDTVETAFEKTQGQLNAKGTGNGTVTSVAALTIGTTGTDLSSTVATGTTTPVITLQVPTASATNRGVLSAANWSTFNGKEPAIAAGTTAQYYRGDKSWQALNSTAVGLGNVANTAQVTSVTGTAPVVSSGGLTPAISMAAASGTVNGYLTSANWTTFNNKTSTGTGTANTVPKYTAAGAIGNSNITDTGTAISTAVPINGASATEMGYLSGVTSGIQAQLGTKIPYTGASFLTNSFITTEALPSLGSTSVGWGVETNTANTFVYVGVKCPAASKYVGIISFRSGAYGVALQQIEDTSTLECTGAFQSGTITAATYLRSPGVTFQRYQTSAGADFAGWWAVYGSTAGTPIDTNYSIAGKTDGTSLTVNASSQVAIAIGSTAAIVFTAGGTKIVGNVGFYNTSAVAKQTAGGAGTAATAYTAVTVASTTWGATQATQCTNMSTAIANIVTRLNALITSYNTTRTALQATSGVGLLG